MFINKKKHPKSDDVPTIETGPLGVEALEDTAGEKDAPQPTAGASADAEGTAVTPPLPAAGHMPSAAAAPATDTASGASASADDDVFTGDLDPAEQEAYAQLKRMRAARKRKRNIKIGIAAGVVALLVGGFFIWKNVMANAGDAERMVATMPAYRGTFVDQVNASGSIQPASSTAIAPTIDGTIESVNVVPGQHVDKGDVLFTIKNDELDRAVASAGRDVRSAQAAADQAWAAYSAAKQGQAGEDGWIAPDQATINDAYATAESAQIALEAANEAYSSAVAQADLRNVTSPAAGNIVELSATPGASVTQAMQNTGSLCKVADLSQMKVTVQVGEIDIDKVAVDQKAAMSFSALDGVELEAKVVSVAAVSSSSGDMYGGGGSATYAVELLIPEPDARLKPGMTAQVRIITQQVDDTLIVPSSALTDMGDGTATLQVEIDPDAHEMREVTVKVDARSSSEAAVTPVAGTLADGDEVVVADTAAYADMDGMGEDDIYAETYDSEGNVDGGSVVVE